MLNLGPFSTGYLTWIQNCWEAAFFLFPLSILVHKPALLQVLGKITARLGWLRAGKLGFSWSPPKWQPFSPQKLFPFSTIGGFFCSNIILLIEYYNNMCNRSCAFPSLAPPHTHKHTHGNKQKRDCNQEIQRKLRLGKAVMDEPEKDPWV